MQISSLALAYQNASLINYTTTDDIDNVRDILEAQYEKVFNNPSVSQNTKDFPSKYKYLLIQFPLECLRINITALLITQKR
jgi:hypothetical protein